MEKTKTRKDSANLCISSDRSKRSSGEEGLSDSGEYMERLRRGVRLARFTRNPSTRSGLRVLRPQKAAFSTWGG
jgi:hypothetical protein